MNTWWNSQSEEDKLKRVKDLMASGKTLLEAEKIVQGSGANNNWVSSVFAPLSGKVFEKYNTLFPRDQTDTAQTENDDVIRLGTVEVPRGEKTVDASAAALNVSPAAPARPVLNVSPSAPRGADSALGRLLARQARLNRDQGNKLGQVTSGSNLAGLAHLFNSYVRGRDDRKRSAELESVDQMVYAKMAEEKRREEARRAALAIQLSDSKYGVDL